MTYASKVLTPEISDKIDIPRGTFHCIVLFSGIQETETILDVVVSRHGQG